MKIHSIVIALIAVGTLAACTDASDPTPEPTATPSPSATAAPYAVPEIGAGEIARVTFDEAAAPESGEIIISGAIADDGAVRVDGDCDGSEVGFRVITAAVDGAGETLLEGSIPCGVAEPDPFSYTVDYSGPAQIMLTDTDGSTKGWVRLSAEAN
ncbi:hypothetical protein [Agromyces atrinae]|uniref:Uncharacterized protein n=1 Tax=Agromyces atrinae TaxID=592376 RepID=A0A4Q2M2R6_9MICO|nr:hypothetical protein [Agromyces atrinae]NYD68732.1 hypothetical protein [Agromyces atrinae]RXZ86089.1 hypothetical protein ESP50_12905 [Agromyces atrinae]